MQSESGNGEPGDWADLDRRIRRLEERDIGAEIEFFVSKNVQFIDKQNPTYGRQIADLLRDYKSALYNVKQLGYKIGLEEIERSGVIDRMNKPLAPLHQPLGSKLCTQEDCESDWYLYWLVKLKSGFVYHRKLWEFCYIAQQLYAMDMLQPGRMGLGFGCGEEPLPSLWAVFGAGSVATDLDTSSSMASGQGWIDAGAHGSSREKLLNRNICPDEAKLDLIQHDFADMNDIPTKFREKFDFCWSSCAFEHLGSIEKGLIFIEESMKVLRPGGVSVHTTEFNLADGETLDNWPTVLFQRQHIETLACRLEEQGYVVAPLDFGAGNKVLDGLFDIPPWPWDVEKLNWEMLYTYAHLKKSIDGVPCTSVGITVTRPA